jgi:hypothetical protein
MTSKSSICARSPSKRCELVRFVREPTRDRTPKNCHHADQQYGDKGDQEPVLGDCNTRFVSKEAAHMGLG